MEGPLFESQVSAQCGLHALNHLVGGPQFLPCDLEHACRQVVLETGGLSSDHVSTGGWYSHNVPAQAIQETVPPRWRLLLTPLRAPDLYMFLNDPLILGALVNMNNTHWIALVKHGTFLWRVDSLKTPRILTPEALDELLNEHPNAYPLVLNEYSG